jgi:hypothetical protein
MAYKQIMRGRRRPFRRSKSPSAFGVPKFAVDDIVGNFTILRYEGHSAVNKRNAQTMSKAQHWYRCTCSCGTEEYRSQQELVDPRRQQCCFECRTPTHKEVNEDDHNHVGSSGD